MMLRSDIVRVLMIAKNIPLPGYDENTVVLKLARDLESDPRVFVQVVHPKEAIPNWLLPRTGRMSAYRNLPPSFPIFGINIKVLTFIRLAGWLEWFFSGCFLSPKSITHNKVDVVHAHYVFPDGIIAQRIAIKIGAKYAVTIRQGDLNNISKNWVNRWLFKRIITKADMVICLTPMLADKVRDISSSITPVIIPNYIDDCFYRVPITKPSSFNKLKIVVVAKMIKRKNISWVIDAARKLDDQLELVVVGDGPCESELRKVGVGRFTGRLDNVGVMNELDQADIFVLPSEKESFGLVYIEAASRYTIVVGLAGTGVDGINSDGFFFVKSKEKLFDLLSNLSSLSAIEIDRLKKCAFESAMDFRGINVRDKLINRYEELATL